jgi:hypothetical protein
VLGPGVIRFLSVRAAQAGPHGLPVIFNKAGKMMEIETPPTGPSGRPLVLSPSGNLVEVERVVVGGGKLIFLDKAGNPISRARPFFRTPLVAQFRGALSAVPLIGQKFMIGTRPIFVDPSGNVVEVEQGQAGDSAVLQAQNGSLVYYGIHTNDVFAYFLTGVAQGQITPGTSFPTTTADLAPITAFASAHGVTFPDSNPPTSSALAVEVKTSWVEASKLSNPNDYVTAMGTIPTYVTSNPNQLTPNGEKTVQLALVGIHIVGSTAGHPEMIWATFEHLGNTPNDTYQYVNQNGQTTLVPRNTAGTWLFSKSNSTGPFNCMLMIEQSGNIVPATTAPPCPPGAFASSDTIRSKAWGAAVDQTPNPIDPTPAASNSEVISINNSVRGMMPGGDVRTNYFMTGATWTIGGASPTSSFDGNFAENEVGTSKMANTTMETYQQGDNSFASGSNCFDCHHGITTDLGLCPMPPLQAFSLSHIFPCLQPLSTSQMLVHVSRLPGTVFRHKILVTVLNSGAGAPMAGAAVTVSDPTAGVTASGTTAANGTVTLEYPRCVEVIDGELPASPPGRPPRQRIFPVPCDGTVQAPQFTPAGFVAP